MTNPEDFEPDLDTLTRAQLHELGMPGEVADVLDDWLHRNHGMISGRHYAGDFLEALATAGYRVEAIEAPSFEELLPAAVD